MYYTDRDYFIAKINEEELNNLTGNSDVNLYSAISSADSMINSYLKNVVSVVPFQFPPNGTPEVDPGDLSETAVNVPPMIKQCSYDIAMFYLHDRIQYSEIPGWVKDKYNAAIDYLTKIAKGIISMDVDTISPTAENYVKPDDNVEYFSSETVMERGGF